MDAYDTKVAAQRAIVAGSMPDSLLSSMLRGAQSGLLPPAMASAPTVTFTSDSNPVASFGANYATAYDTTKVTHLGGVWVRDGGNIFSKPVVATSALGGDAYSSADNGSHQYLGPAALACTYQGTSLKLAVYARDGASKVQTRVRNNGRWEDCGTVISLTTGQAGFITVTFAAASTNAIRFDCDRNMLLFGIVAGEEGTGTISPYIPRGPSEAIMVDSFGMPTATFGWDASLPVWAGQFQASGYLLGCDRFDVMSVPGTGLVFPGGNTNFLDRFAADVIARGPYKSVRICCSVNDAANGVSPAAQVANLNACLDLIPAAWGAIKKVENVPYVSNANATAYAASNIAIAAAVAARGDVNVFIDRSNWVYGTGSITDLKDDGNADLCTAADKIHLSPYGQDYSAIRRREIEMSLLAA